MCSLPSKNEDIESGQAAPEAAAAEDQSRVSPQDNDVDHSSSSPWPLCLPSSTIWLVVLIAVVGFGVSGAFFALGVRGARNDQKLRLEKQASDLVKAIQATWNDYKWAALWIHDGCRSSRNHGKSDTSLNICSRRDFRGMYEYLLASELEVQSIAFVPNVTHADRPELEAEARAFYGAHYPQVNYSGFIGMTPSDDASSYRIGPMRDSDFYFPQHLIEPVVGNEHLIDFDIYSVYLNFHLVDEAVSSWTTILSNPIPSNIPGKGSYMFLLNPGTQLSFGEEKVSSGLSSVTFYFSSLVSRAARLVEQSEPVSVYIYDTTSHVDRFFGAARWNPGQDIVTEEKVELSTLRRKTHARYLTEHVVPIEHQEWTIAVVANEGSFEPDLAFAIIGGVLIFVGSCCLALWLRSSVRRAAHIAKIKNEADAEKAALIVESATRAANAEADLNNYLCHEVRNPLSAAMAAGSFLAFAHQEDSPIVPGDERHKAIQDDINIIQSSLGLINDLLRSMLDMSKATNKQIELVETPTDMLKDVLEPVRTILYRHDSPFDMTVECPSNMIVVVDRLRLKQVVLNLASNAKKFVQQKGFIRVRAKVIDNKLQILVEDSGPGIPESKRPHLFSRFQESLDRLAQGTGIGLNLCKTLVELMGGEIFMDETYNSGLEGLPGTRFVINLMASPVDPESVGVDHKASSVPVLPDSKGEESSCASGGETVPSKTEESNSDMGDLENEMELPEKLSVLVVDDDLVLRKLLSRSLKRVAPGWTIQEASNGETALSLTANNDFDLIFLDQYMASVEKQLLGSETAAAMRSRGVKSRICGLSANNVEETFINAGADTFLLKPFGCEKEALMVDLHRALYG